MFKWIKNVGLVLLFGVLFILLLGQFSCNVASAKGDQEAQSLLNEKMLEQLSNLDLKELQAYLDSLEGYSGGKVSDRLMEYVKGGVFDGEGFLAQMSAVFFSKIRDLLPSFACIASITLICGILTSLNSQITSQATGQTFFLVAYAATLVPALAVITECFLATKTTISSLSTQMQLVFPVILTLIAASGGGATAAIFRPAVAFLSNTIVSLISTIILPITIAVVAFSMAGHLSTNIKIGKFAAFFKSIIKWIMGISLSVFGLFFTVQGLTAASFDGVVKKVTQYAIGTGVPIVGGFLSGGFDLAVAGSVLIKNSLGGMSIFLMVTVLIEPVILLVSVNLLLRLTSALTQPFGDERISNFLTETADNLNFCSACVIVTAFLYFICIVLFVCSAEVFV